MITFKQIKYFDLTHEVLDMSDVDSAIIVLIVVSANSFCQDSRITPEEVYVRQQADGFHRAQNKKKPHRLLCIPAIRSRGIFLDYHSGETAGVN